METKIHKIKISDGKPTISHTSPDAKGNNVRFDDIPYPGLVHKDFQAALDAFCIDLATDTEMDYKEGDYFMHGISIKDGKGAGVTLSGHKIKSNGAAFNFNSSFIHFTGNGENQYIYLDDLVKKVERVQKEAVAYLDGSKRGVDQLDLFNQPEEPVTKMTVAPPAKKEGVFQVETAAGVKDLVIDELPLLPTDGVIADVDKDKEDREIIESVEMFRKAIPQNEAPKIGKKLIPGQELPAKPKGTATGRKRVAQTSANPSGIVND